VHRKTEEISTCLSPAFPIQYFNRDRRCRTAAEVVLMAKRTMWKVAAAVLAVIIAGIVYCVFFAEEKDGTVQYQTGTESEGNDGGLSEVSGESNAAQVSNRVTQNSGTSLSSGTGQQAMNDGIVQSTGNEKSSGQTGTDTQNSIVTLVYVHVCGAVKNPAVYSLPEGSRVCDAIAKAGGLMETAADDYVNQARFLSDGERVYIPEKGELSSLSASQYAAGQPVNNAGGSQCGSNVQTGGQEPLPVNINTAGISELTTLPGIGESRAESIIAYREMHGAFSKIEDIMKISGIKGAAYEKIKERICTGNE